LIASRKAWIALSAAVMAAAAIVVIVRSRRRPASPDAVVPPAQTESEAVSGWPAVPVLGTPTEDDLKRYAAKPSVLDRPAFARFFEPGEPREPLDEVARRRLMRWGVAGLALLMLAAGTEVLESAVFSKETAVASLDGQSREFQGASCPEADAACSFAGNERQDVLSPQPTEVPVVEIDADCRPGGADARVRKLDAKVTRAVDRQWRRIEAYLKAKAPKSYRTLGKPGKAADIAAAEAYMGMAFPDDLRASLLRHDGVVPAEDTWAFGFLGHANSTVGEIRDTWRELCEIDGDEGASGPRADWWDGRMLPFGADGIGDHLVIDSVRRDVGVSDDEGGMSFTPGGVRLGSYYALLKATAGALEKGGAIGRWKPRVVAGELEWGPR
jgi:hypothetical protein